MTTTSKWAPTQPIRMLAENGKVRMQQAWGLFDPDSDTPDKILNMRWVDIPIFVNGRYETGEDDTTFWARDDFPHDKKIVLPS